tara:strand:+ start:21531 stop:21734 length:204 start_codon:yes stop_codon:yes gene_type:complete
MKLNIKINSEKNTPNDFTIRIESDKYRIWKSNKIDNTWYAERRSGQIGTGKTFGEAVGICINHYQNK